MRINLAYNILGSIALIGLVAQCRQAQSVEALSVATFNVAQLTGDALDEVINIVKAVDADIYGLQETDQGQGAIIANALGYHFAQGDGPSRSFVSRYPILEVTPSGLAARVQISNDQQAWIMNTHFSLHPNWEISYIPYAASHGVLTGEQMVDNVLALDNWITAMDAIEAELWPIINQGQGKPIFFTADFNEPSHLDWTEAQTTAGIIPTAVDAPLSHVMTDGLKVDRVTDLLNQHGTVFQEDVHIDVDYEGFGFQDSYHVDRVQDGEDETTRRGFTWTPYAGAGRDDDRIDFVYYRGDNLSVVDSQVFGESGGVGVDIGFDQFPSDHRGVVSTFSIPTTTACTLLVDLNGDCTLDAADWEQFRSGQHADMSGLTRQQAYDMGDLNGDFRNNHADFVMFKTAFEDANGSGSFEAMIAAVPEPTTWRQCAIGLVALRLSRRCLGNCVPTRRRLRCVH